MRSSGSRLMDQVVDLGGQLDLAEVHRAGPGAQEHDAELHGR